MNTAKDLSWLRKAAVQGHQSASERVAELEAMQSPPVMSTLECANCGVAEAPGGATLKPCARCKSVEYCGRDYQRGHLKAPGGHRNSCPVVSN